MKRWGIHNGCQVHCWISQAFTPVSILRFDSELPSGQCCCLPALPGVSDPARTGALLRIREFPPTAVFLCLSLLCIQQHALGSLTAAALCRAAEKITPSLVSVVLHVVLTVDVPVIVTVRSHPGPTPVHALLGFCGLINIKGDSDSWINSVSICWFVYLMGLVKADYYHCFYYWYNPLCDSHLSI